MLNFAFFMLAILDIILGISAFILGDKYPKGKFILGVLCFIILIPISILGFLSFMPDRKLTTSSQTDENTLPAPLATSQNKWKCSGENIIDSSEHVTIERLGTCHLSLSNGEILVGTADRFQEDVDLPEQPQPPCTAFVITGPMIIDVKIWWGGWDYHSNLNDEIIDNYLSQKKAECKKNHPDRDVKTVKLP